MKRRRAVNYESLIYDEHLCARAFYGFCSIFYFFLNLSQISDRSLNFPECLRVVGGQKPLMSEFHSTALPGLAALAPYHAYLEPQTQQRIVRCLLKYGMGKFRAQHYQGCQHSSVTVRTAFENTVLSPIFLTIYFALSHSFPPNRP